MSEADEQKKQAGEKFREGVLEGMRKATEIAESAKLETMVVAVLGSPEFMRIAEEFSQRTIQAALGRDDLREKVSGDPLAWRTHALIENVVLLAGTLRDKAKKHVAQPSPLERWQPEGAPQ